MFVPLTLKMWQLHSSSFLLVRPVFLLLSLQHQISYFPQFCFSHGFPYTQVCISPNPSRAVNYSALSIKFSAPYSSITCVWMLKQLSLIFLQMIKIHIPTITKILPASIPSNSFFNSALLFPLFTLLSYCICSFCIPEVIPIIYLVLLYSMK